MPAPDFKWAAVQFDEPWKTLIEIVAGRFYDDNYFENFVIAGKYDGEERVDMNAWSIVGFAPRTRGFVECHLTAARNDQERLFWIAELRDVLKVLPKTSRIEEVVFQGGVVHFKLGLDKYHVIGMVSLHQARASRKSFACLWKHPRLDRAFVEQVMAFTLDERLIP